jgi:hypothetical protein
MKTKLMITTAVAAVMGLSAANVHAQTLETLANGGTVTFTANNNVLLGASSTTSTTAPITATAGTVSGEVASAAAVVAQNSVSNPLGGLVFVYQVELTGGDLNSLALTGFGNITVDVGYSSQNSYGLSLGSVAPTSVTSDDGTITFDFTPNVNSGTTTYALIVDTSLTTITSGLGLIQDSDQGNAPILVPNIPSVPDGGTTAMLLGAGLSGLALLKRKLVA